MSDDDIPELTAADFARMRPRSVTKKWKAELAAIEAMAPAIFLAKPDAIVGVAVDDEVKRDYFMSRLQRMLNEHQWPGTFRVISMNGDPVVFLRARA